MSGSANERYSRQILFSPIGAPGQLRLSQSVVAIVGCGATGSAVAALLARAGVGRLRIIDRDYVEASNLQRQSLFDEADARESLPKALAAARKIAQFNSGVSVQPEVADLVPENAGALLGDGHLILDGTDNFETRYLLNDFAVSRALPWIYAAALGSYCATMNIIPEETACLACMFPEPPRATETCDTIGILNSAVNLVASVQASEAIKFLVGARDQMRRSLLSWDVWSNQRAEVLAEKPRPDCRVCGAREFTYLEGKNRAPVTLLCGRDAVQIHESHRPVDFREMSRKLDPHGRVRHNEFVLKFWREPYELTLFPDGRAIIKGTSDAAQARSFYARFVGA
ncbi:MAG TPA: ThiF family adenylyltransferase [Terriglobales bacterium]|nr:ThiF family adenylyltransferase [Terriglobales bacterium]